MPIYEYQCTNCGHALESIQKLSDDPLKVCPACNKNELKKLVSASSFRLKGGGWYETDFKTENKKQLADSGNSERESTKTTKDVKTSTGEGSAKEKPVVKNQTKANTNTSK